MPAIRITITTLEYQLSNFSWYEIYGSQTNWALGSVVANAEFNVVGFSTSFIHSGLIVGETWFYWVRAAYDRGASYSALRALGSITALDTAGSSDGGAVAEDRVVELIVSAKSDPALTVGDDKLPFRVPEEFAGYTLTAIRGSLTDASSSGIVTIQLRNATAANDILSTKLTIDATETDSSTATTPAVINPANATLVGAHAWAIDIDVAGTGAKGLVVALTLSPP